MKQQTMNIRKPKWIIMSLPLILSLWSIYALSKPKYIVTENSAFLSPPATNEALIIGLTIFSVAYVIFLLIMFSDNLKEYFYNARLQKK